MGETFDKIKDWAKGVIEDPLKLPEYLSPIKRSNIRGITKAFQETDPELARREFLDIAGTAALFAIPVEKLLAPVFKPLTGPLKKGFDSFKEGFTSVVGKPMGKFVERWGWGPIRTGVTKRRSVEELDPLSRLNLEDSSKRIQQEYAKFPSGKMIGEKGKEQYEVKDLLKYAAENIPKRPIHIPNDFDQYNPLNQLDLNSFSQIEQEAAHLLGGPYESLKSILNIPNTLGVSSPQVMHTLVQDKAAIRRHIEPYVHSLVDRVNKLGRGLGVKNIMDLALRVVENPSLEEQLPKEAKNLPKIIHTYMDSIFNVVKESGFDIHYVDNYVTHSVRGWKGSFWENVPEIRKVSELVRYILPRKFHTTLDVLKDIADERIWKPDQIPGYKEATEEGQASLTKLFNEAVPYLVGKQVMTDTKDVLTAYFSAFSHSQLAKTLENVLKESYVHPNFQWLRGSIAPEEREALSSLFKKVRYDLREVGNKEAADKVLEIQRILGAYVPGDQIGMSPTRLYHPNLAPEIKKNLLLPTPSKAKQAALGLLSTIKSLKLMSMFHSLNFTDISLTLGLGVDHFFIGSELKKLGTQEGKRKMAEAMASQLDLFLPKRLFKESHELLEQATGNMGVFTKVNQLIESNPMSKYIFEMQGPVDQMKIFELETNKLLRNEGIQKMIKEGPIVKGDLQRGAAHFTNVVMGSLRPEAMSVMAKEAGNVFFLARNWTYSNFYLLMNALNEWFIKTPSAVGVLPKELSGVFLKGMSAIQTMEGLPLEVQIQLRKDMADFVGVALARHMWRLQVASLAMSGHTSFENEPGHELEADTGLVEIKSDRTGRLTPYRVYVSSLGWKADIWNMSPFHLPISEVIHTGNLKEILKPWNYFDLGKVSKTILNKGNVAWHSAFDIRTALLHVTDIQERNIAILKSIGKPFVPIPIEASYKKLMQEYKDPEAALEILIMNTLGYPRLTEAK